MVCVTYEPIISGLGPPWTLIKYSYTANLKLVLIISAAVSPILNLYSPLKWTMIFLTSGDERLEKLVELLLSEAVQAGVSPMENHAVYDTLEGLGAKW